MVTCIFSGLGHFDVEVLGACDTAAAAKRRIVDQHPEPWLKPQKNKYYSLQPLHDRIVLACHLTKQNALDHTGSTERD